MREKLPNFESNVYDWPPELALTLVNRLRAALELRKAKSTAAWSMRVRFVQSGRRATRAVSNWEGPCGASVGVFGREPSFGVDGVGVTALPQGVGWRQQ